MARPPVYIEIFLSLCSNLHTQLTGRDTVRIGRMHSEGKLLLRRGRDCSRARHDEAGERAHIAQINQRAIRDALRPRLLLLRATLGDRLGLLCLLRLLRLR